MKLEVTRWQGSQPPQASELRESLRREPHTYSFWSNDPDDTYATHEHSYDKLLVCLRGSITFTLPATGATVELAAGDRLALPAETAHAARVGPDGVECAEAHLARR